MNPPSIPPGSEVMRSEDAWAREVAAALRLILSSGAEETPAQRGKFLEEQVQRSLQQVPPGQRERHLDCLRDYFPVGLVDVPAKAADAPAAVPEVPAAVLALVLAAWSRFTPEQRVELQDQLVAAGVAAPPGAGGAADFTEVRQRLGLAPNESVVAPRLGRLAVHELEFLAKLDQLAWNTWKTLAPRASLKRDTALGDVRVLTRRYLKGDAEPTDTQVSQQIERTRQLIASLLGSISQVGRGYAKRHQTRYSPEAIQDLVKMEGGGSGWLGGGLETKCWRKYCELAGEVNEATIQNEMQEVVVKYVEELMRGMAKGGA